MSRTIGIFTESSDRNPEIDLCRLCRKNHDCYYSIFTSNVACKITVKDALYDLVGLQIAVGDGLPTTMCPPCLKKLTEFSVFKKICLKSDAVLRKSCIRSFEGGGADDEESEPCVETKDFIQDVIENTSEFACSDKMTEVYFPVPDCLLPRDDNLCHVKEENQDHLSEENNPVLYTDSAGISNYDSDPLMTDELSDRVTYKCTSVKEDQISDDEEGLHVLNDCSDGVSNKLMHQDSSDQPNTLTASQGEKVEAQSRGNIVADLDLTLIGAKKEVSPEENAQRVEGEGAVNENLRSSPETKDCIRDAVVGTAQVACSVQPAEIFIPVPDIQLPTANMLAPEGGAEAYVSEGDLPEDQQSEEYDEEESFCLRLESDSDEGDDCRNSDAGTKVALKAVPDCIDVIDRMLMANLTSLSEDVTIALLDSSDIFPDTIDWEDMLSVIPELKDYDLQLEL